MEGWGPPVFGWQAKKGPKRETSWAGTASAGTAPLRLGTFRGAHRALGRGVGGGFWGSLANAAQRAGTKTQQDPRSSRLVSVVPRLSTESHPLPSAAAPRPSAPPPPPFPATTSTTTTTTTTTAPRCGGAGALRPPEAGLRGAAGPGATGELGSGPPPPEGGPPVTAGEGARGGDRSRHPRCSRRSLRRLRPQRCGSRRVPEGAKRGQGGSGSRRGAAAVAGCGVGE